LKKNCQNGLKKGKNFFLEKKKIEKIIHEKFFKKMIKRSNLKGKTKEK